MNDFLERYQQFTPTTAVYPEANTGTEPELTYLALGLVGEAGEVAEKIKKKLRDGYFDKDATGKELGDVLYYVVQMCNALNLDVHDVLRNNMSKLSSRKDRGALGGSGDNR